MHIYIILIYLQDHGCQDAFCGCILVDTENIIAINHPDATKEDFNTAGDSDSDESISMEDMDEEDSDE